MKHHAARISLLLAALFVSACATLPGAGDAGSAAISRPLSDVSPSTPAESRARVHVDLGMAYFEIGRYDVALDEARIALNDSPDYAPAYHLLWLNFPEHSIHCFRTITWSYNPGGALPHHRFGLFPVRSPLLGESLFIFSSSGY